MANIFATPHVGSPGTTSRRLSLGTPALLTNKNDADELRERRKSKVIEIQNKHLSSPLTPNKSSPKNTSSSNPLKGFSVTQLTEHYTNCVQLNAENKITTKNAFGLHLIDYMTDLLKGKKLGDFQVAGTTLDASAKIYASRVDAIHSETYKVLSTLSRGNKKKSSNGKKSGDEDGESDYNDDDDDAGSKNLDGAKKERKKKKRNTLIETNLKNINVEKLEIDFEMDPLFKSLSASYAEGNSCLLLSAISCYTDSCDIVLDSSSLIKDIENKKVHSSFRDSIDIEEIKNHIEKSKFSNTQICPTFSTFEFNDWNEQEAMRTNDELNPDYAFDADAEHEDISNCFDNDDDYAGEDNDPSVHNNDLNGDVVGTVGNNHVGDGENILSLTESAMLQKTTLTSITNVSSLVDFLAAAPSEYSFFNNKLLQTWKGPTHWKIHPLAQLNNKRPSNRTVTKKVKILLNFSEKRDFTEDFRKARSCVLTKKKLESFKKENTTLPKILNYEASFLFSTFLKPNLLVRRQKCSSTNADDLVGDYDYNNCNDKENYCPAYDQAGDDGNCDDTLEDLFGFSCITSNSSHQSDDIGGDMSKLSTLDGDGLIAQPHKVDKININYAKAAKKIDVRRLKESMWKLLSSPSENKENVDTNSNSPRSNVETPDRIHDTRYFSEIMKKLPISVPNFMANNVSIPIAFVCLLHLANEKGLQLLQTHDMKEIEICQPV